MPSILIVDDSPTQAEFMRALLTEEGFEVICLEDGAEALEALRERRPDLIVSDIMMPRMNGFELCRTIKANPQWQNVPMLLVTALHDPLEMIKALECGADNYVTKPFEPAYLINRIRALLASREGGPSVHVQTVVELTFLGRQFRINYDRQQILSMLIASFEDVVAKNEELKLAHAQLAAAKSEIAQDLERTRTNLAAIYEAIPDAVALMDLDRRLVTCNPAFVAMFGYDESYLVGRPVELLRAERADRSGQTLYRRRDGSTFTGESKVTPARSPDGQTMGYVQVIRDITARLQLEEEFRQAQKMEAVGRLAGGVAHDFNNLLTVILGGSEMLRRTLEEDGLNSAWREDLKSILDAATKATSLTRQLLTLSKRQISQQERFDLNSVMGGMQQLLQRLIGKDVELLMTQSDRPAWVLSDRSQMEQVILNLAVNARDAMPDGGRLHLVTSVTRVEGADTVHFELEEGDYCVLAVTDSGCGIEKSVRDRIFDPFFTTKSTGTGLGLSTVYSIVQRARGRIWVYSELGQGTTFKVYLPYHADTPEAAAPTPAVRNRGAAGQETLLVVEDDERVRRFTRRALEQRHYTVLEAARGEDAVRLAETYPGPIHLMLTDMVMPRMGGRELSKNVASLRPDIKIIYTSGYTEDAVCSRDVHDHPLWFLEKPFTLESLRSKVREVLDSP